MDSPMEPYPDSMLAASTILVKKKKTPPESKRSPESEVMARWAEMRAQKLTAERRSEIAKKAANTRWKKKTK